MIINFKPGRGGSVSLFAGGEFVCKVDADFVLSCGHKDNEDIDGAELAAFIEEAGSRSAFIAALRLLSMRDHGREELIRKLCEKGHCREFAVNAVQRAEELGYIDDEAFAEAYASKLLNVKGFSPKKIRYELIMKGISREIADKIAESLDFDADLRIIEILQTKYSNALSDEKCRRRAVNALMRMGYSYSDIGSALRRLESEL